MRFAIATPTVLSIALAAVVVRAEATEPAAPTAPAEQASPAPAARVHPVALR